MNSISFHLKTQATQRVDMSAITPDNLAGKSLAEISAITLPVGKHQIRVDELFEINAQGNDADEALEINIHNSSIRLDYIGNSMKTGRITVHGDVGSYFGYHMRKGELILNGNANDFAASGLTGGLIQINGNVGDYLGAAIVGDKKGMKGGMVIISGNAGDRVGDQMRRGIILIAGNVGSYCASRMLAGTIGVLGTVGEYIGFGMRRGTLLLTQTPQLHVTMQDCGTHTLPFLSLMFKSFRGLPTPFANLNQNRVQRYAGDIANDGRGEILVLV